MSLGIVDPIHSTTASYIDSNLSRERSFPRHLFVLNIIPSLSRSLTLLSIIFLSNLKSGIPNLSRPPTSSSFSYTVTLCPLLFNSSAQASPAGPEPITATFLSDLFMIVLGFT